MERRQVQKTAGNNSQPFVPEVWVLMAVIELDLAAAAVLMVLLTGVVTGQWTIAVLDVVESYHGRPEHLRQWVDKMRAAWGSRPAFEHPGSGALVLDSVPELDWINWGPRQL